MTVPKSSAVSTKKVQSVIARIDAVYVRGTPGSSGRYAWVAPM